jgi:hypothetical protein
MTEQEHEQRQNFPLDWPVAVPRTLAADRKQAQFGKRMDWNRLLQDLTAELARLGAESYILSTNQPVRKDGSPVAQTRKIADPGVALYFKLHGEHLCFPCDRWLTIPQNVRAIILHIEAMRGMERWGVGTAKQAFMGYKALTATAGEGEPWWTVLGIERTAPEGLIREAHLRLVRQFHPDRPGGSSEQMARINTARDRGLAERAGQQ